MVGPAVTFKSTSNKIRREPPLLGQHTDEILTSLGYDAGEIESLRSKNVIWSSNGRKPPVPMSGNCILLFLLINIFVLSIIYHVMFQRNRIHNCSLRATNSNDNRIVAGTSAVKVERSLFDTLAFHWVSPACVRRDVMFIDGAATKIAIYRVSVKDGPCWHFPRAVVVLGSRSLHTYMSQ